MKPAAEESIAARVRSLTRCNQVVARSPAASPPSGPPSEPTARDHRIASMPGCYLDVRGRRKWRPFARNLSGPYLGADHRLVGHVRVRLHVAITEAGSPPLAALHENRPASRSRGDRVSQTVPFLPLGDYCSHSRSVASCPGWTSTTCGEQVLPVSRNGDRQWQKGLAGAIPPGYRPRALQRR